MATYNLENVNMWEWEDPKYGNFSNSKITVIKRAPNGNRRQARWECKCSCGNPKTFIVDAQSLRNGHTKSCGCISSYNLENTNMWEWNNEAIPDSKITVIKDSGQRSGREKKWECKCNCGNPNTFLVLTNHLTSGKTKSCGCLQKEKASENTIDMTGINMWEYSDKLADSKISVIKRYGSNSCGQATWECKCNCGNPNSFIVVGKNLRLGITLSCGCIGNSKGEIKIKEILNKANIIYQTEKTYNDCRFTDSNKLARYDFYLPKYNVLIEYDGEGHFQYSNNGYFTKETFEKIQQHDQYKNQYCIKNNIPLIRIPYTHYNDLCLDDLLPETSKFKI